MRNQLRLMQSTLTIYTKPKRIIPSQLHMYIYIYIHTYILDITCNADESDKTTVLKNE